MGQGKTERTFEAALMSDTDSDLVLPGPPLPKASLGNNCIY